MFMYIFVVGGGLFCYAHCDGLHKINSLFGAKKKKSRIHVSKNIGSR